MSRSLTFLIGVMAAVGGGCVSHISMTKVTPTSNPRGLRVHLPAPFVVGTPQPDGSVEYHVELLPDPDQEYAIAAWSFLAKQKVTLNRTIELYLQKAEITQDTTAVAKAMADAAGEVSKTAVSTLVQKQKDQATKDETAATAHRDAIASKKTDIANQTVTRDKAAARKERAIDRLNAAKTDEEKRAAQEELYAANGALADAEFELAAATKALDQVKRSFFDDPLAKQAAARETKASSRKLPKAQGPVIFRIAEDPQSGGIRLVQVPWQLFSFNGQPSQTGGQLKFETQGKKPDKGGDASKPENPTPMKKEFTISTYTSELTAIVAFSTPPQKLHTRECTITNADAGDASQYVTLSFSEKKGTVDMTWVKDTPKGDYSVGLALTFKDAGYLILAVKVKVK